MPIVIPSGSTPTAAMESLVLDGLALNDESIFVLEAFAFNPAPKRQRWIQGEDADGSALAEPSRSENATATMTLRVVPQGTMDSALAQIGKIADKLYEAEQQPDGIPLVWTPATGTKTATAYVLSGEITDLPFTPESGYWVYAPLLTVRFDCKPFMYGTRQTNYATVSASTSPIQTLTLASVPGDVPALGEIVVTDAATQTRRHVEWGLQWRYYDAATSLQINSASLVTSGFAGTSTTRAGSFNTNVIRSNLFLSTPIAIAGTGNLGHVGSYIVKARVYPVIASGVTSDMKVRLNWKEGDGPLSATTYVSPPAGTAQWSEVELGRINIPPKTSGTQRWTGQIEAYSTTEGDTLDIDYIVLVPTEVYGKARAPYVATTPTVFSAADSFNQTAGSLGGKTADVGGNWTAVGTVGAADLTVDATNHIATRTTGTADASNFGRGATLPVTLADKVVQIDYAVGASAALLVWPQVMARYVDESNFIRAYPLWVGQQLQYLALEIRVAGVIINGPGIQQVPDGTTYAANSWWTLRLVVRSGTAEVWHGPQGSTLSLIMSASKSALSPGGVLDDGLPGFRDAQTTGGATSTRSYDHFLAWPIPAPDAVVYSGRTAEIRYDAAQRQDSTGTYYGNVRSYRGARVFIPPAGDENRTSRLLVKARRNDIDTEADANVADSTTVAVHLTPRYSTVPR